MITYDIIQQEENNPTGFDREQIANFLHEHLDEYGDAKEHIAKSIGYAYGDNPGQDGHILIAHENDMIVGAVIINKTNMGGYIPENILVYIAVHGDKRGQGLGKGLMEHIIQATEGDIALHVEPENPARYLYEKYGFTNKYLEYRLTH